MRSFASCCSNSSVVVGGVVAVGVDVVVVVLVGSLLMKPPGLGSDIWSWIVMVGVVDVVVGGEVGEVVVLVFVEGTK